MKNLIYILVVVLLVFTSCSNKEDEAKLYGEYLKLYHESIDIKVKIKGQCLDEFYFADFANRQDIPVSQINNDSLDNVVDSIYAVKYAALIQLMNHIEKQIPEKVQFLKQ